MGVRIHALAKELGISSKDIMEFLDGRGIRVKNHMSSISENDAMTVRIFLEEDPEPEPEVVEETPKVTIEETAEVESATEEPVTEEPVTEAIVEPVAEPVVEPVAEVAAEEAAVEVSEPEIIEEATPEVVSTPDEVQASTEDSSTEAAEIHEPVEAPVEAPVDAPVEAPVDAPVEAMVEAPVEAPVDAPVEAPVDAPVEAMVEETAKEDSVEIPSESNIESISAESAPQEEVKEPESESTPAEESPAKPVQAEIKPPPRKKPTKIVMAPGYGGPSSKPVAPVAPVARPLDPKSKPLKKAKGRPLIIRSKVAARPAGRSGGPPSGGGHSRQGGGAPGGRGPGGPGRGPGGPGRGPGGPGRGPGGGGRGAGAGTSRPAAPASAHGAKKVMVFPGAEPGAPVTGKRTSGPGRAGPGGKGKGRQQNRPRNQESDFTRRRLQQDLIPEDLPDTISLEKPATIKDLSLALGVKQTALLKKLMNQGMLANVNSPLSEEIVDTLSVEINCEIILEEPKAFETSLDEIENFEDSEGDLILRAPVVTMMGHVDHGKTTLLDKIRESSITKSESGGITQHLSAYRVDKGDAHVVFVDTPGHRAFTNMRARGANVTDVVVLVVAADDGPMPQTEEAIEHAKAAGVPVVVAINKIDRPGANIDMVKTKLAELELSPSDWGGETEMIPVSAITGEGVDKLLEHLSLESELLELTANPDKRAIGTVLDSRASTGQGNVITALVQDGTLSRGDSVVCGPAHGKIRTLRSTSGVNLETAPPSTPVEITGLNDLPEAGDKLYALDSASKAKQIAEERQEAKAKADRAERQTVTLEGLFDTIDKAKTKEINLVVKTDVKGTLDVLKSELSSMRTDEVALRVIRGGVGEISESDVLLADASNAIVVGFHVSASDKARSEAESQGVEIRTYTVIYEILEDMRQALEGMLSPEVSEELQGNVEILNLFKSSKLGNIAGCMVRKGIITRDDKVRLIRDGVLVHEGKLASLKRVKDDAKEVREGFECGLVIKGYNDIKVGDFLESYKVIKTTRKLGETNKSSG